MVLFLSSSKGQPSDRQRPSSPSACMHAQRTHMHRQMMRKLITGKQGPVEKATCHVPTVTKSRWQFLAPRIAALWQRYRKEGGLVSKNSPTSFSCLCHSQNLEMFIAQDSGETSSKGTREEVARRCDTASLPTLRFCAQLLLSISSSASSVNQ